MKVGLIYKEIQNENRLKYVLDFITNHPLNTGSITFSLNEREDVNVHYSKEPPVFGIHVIPQELFFNNQKSNILYANHYIYKGQLLLSVEKEQYQQNEFVENDLIRFDLFEAIFFHVSRLEEMDVPDSQKNDRDQIEESLLFSVKNGIEKVPVVDHLVFAFLQTLSSKTDTRKTSYHLTHDIDFIQKYKTPLSYFRQAGIGILKGSFWSITNQYVRGLFSNKDPYNNFDFLLQGGDRLKKTIYFLVGGTHPYDNTYSLSSGIFTSAVTLAKKRGYEIGIHPSYESWTDHNIIENEKKKLSSAISKEIKKSRQHYLHFDIIETPKALLTAGIDEDSSLGYTRRIGFRCGTGFPYFLYDFENECTSKLLETPLVLMDSAAIHESKKTQIVINDLVDAFILSNQENTHITFNFHNSRFDDAEILGNVMKEVYQSVISQIKEGEN